MNMAAKVSTDLPSFEIPFKKEAAKQLAQSAVVFDVFTTNVRPPMFYPGEPCLPAYKISDIKNILHPDDYTEFLASVEVAGTYEGEEIVYALDYVKWRVEMEK